MRDNTMNICFSDAEVALLEAAASINHRNRTPKGGDVAGMVRASALGAAVETIRKGIDHAVRNVEELAVDHVDCRDGGHAIAHFALQASALIGRLACTAHDLDELAGLLERHAGLVESVKHVDGLAHNLIIVRDKWMDQVPNWGAEPDDTEGLVSYDATRLLWAANHSIRPR